MEKRYFLTRHSIKPKGEDIESELYRGISKKGVELARSSARNIFDYIEKSPNGAVIFLGGVSDEVRTKSTAEVYGNELKKILSGRKDYVVITKEDIPKGRGYTWMAKQVEKIINSNPDKKIVLDIPIFLKEFSPQKESKNQGGWYNKSGKPTAYLIKLIEKHKGNEYDMMKDWITNKGRSGELIGPNPLDVAKSYEKGLGRLERFVKKYAGDRPVVNGIIGHNLNADCYLTYILGGGKVDLATFEKMSRGKGLLKETEMALIEITPDITTLTYRNQEHKAKKDLEQKVSSVVAVGGILGSLFFLSSGVTGNAIGSLSNSSGSSIGIVLLLVGIASAFFYFKNKK
ncbi:MAG: hypothetical protein AABY22_24415 [Nanoarchaeota archaeon]